MGLVDRALAPSISNPGVVRSSVEKPLSHDLPYTVSLLSGGVAREEESSTTPALGVVQSLKSSPGTGEANNGSSTEPGSDDPLGDPLASEWTTPPASIASTSAGQPGGEENPSAGGKAQLDGGGGGTTHASGASSPSGGIAGSGALSSGVSPLAAPASVVKGSGASATLNPPSSAVQPSGSVAALSLTSVKPPAASAAAQALPATLAKSASNGVHASGNTAPSTSPQKATPATPSTLVSPESASSKSPSKGVKSGPTARPLTSSGNTITGTAASPFSVVEGTNWTRTLVTKFTDNNTLGDDLKHESYSALINWGDGTPASLGTINKDGSISGSHTYTDATTTTPYQINVTIEDEDGTSSGTISTSATVTEQPLSPQPVTIMGTEYEQFSGAVASFTDANPYASQNEYSATVAWPDGTKSASVTANGQGGFNVTSSDTFGEEQSGGSSLTVTVTDGTTQTTINSTLEVNDAPLTNANLIAPFVAEIGVPIQGFLGLFTDENPQSSAGDFSGSTIQWGDGTSPAQITVASVNSDGSTIYAISGSHTYTTALSGATVTVNIKDVGGSTASPSTSVTVAANPDPPESGPLLPPATAFDSEISAADDFGGPGEWYDPSGTPEGDSNENNCSCNSPIQDGGNADGGGATDSFSSEPVRFFDGTVNLTATDIELTGYGFDWGQSRHWSNMPGYSASGVNGSGWVISQLPYLRRTAPKNGDADATIVVITNGVDARYFDHTGSTYTERMGGQDTLVHNTGNDTFALTDSMGDVFTFNDFNGSLPVNQKGQFQSFTDPAGNVGQVISRTSDGKPTEFQRSTTSGGVTTTESYVYAYVISGVNAGLLSNVTLRQQVNGGSWSTVRQVAYAYYDGTTSFGNAGDLMTATVEDGSNTVLDTDYYRYYTSNSSTGYVHGLKYSFTGHSYDRLFAALGNNYTTASDSQVAPFADNYFEYDSLQRVTKEVAAGTGTDMNNGTGTSAITYSYSMMSVNAVDYNQWKYKTTETFADGCRQTVYANGYGETMLTVFADSRTNITYLTFHKYDNAGRLIMTAMPSAVTGYGEQYPDLLDNTGGSSYQYIATLSGLLEFTDYYTSTTATATTSGGVLGYVEDTAVQLGTNGPKLLVDATQYIAHSAGGATVYPMATHTLYRVGGDLTTGMTTSYAYTWFSGTTRMQSETDTNPTISSSENGPGTPDVTTTFYDTYGRPIWTKDPDGFINYTAYDPATGAVVKTITDVDTTRTGDFQNLPLNWATPTGGGLHLITQMAVDNMGRTTELIDPNGNLTYTVYKDSIDEIITYPGWQSATNTTTGPTQSDALGPKRQLPGNTDHVGDAARHQRSARRHGGDQQSSGLVPDLPRRRRTSGPHGRLLQPGGLDLFDRRLHRHSGSQLLQQHDRLWRPGSALAHGRCERHDHATGVR